MVVVVVPCVCFILGLTNGFSQCQSANKSRQIFKTLLSILAEFCRYLVCIVSIHSQIIILLLESFSHQHKQMVFHWSLSDNKSPQVPRTLLSILADLNNAVIWTVSIRPVISKSSCPCTNLLMTVPRSPITIDIIIPFMFHSFFQFRSSFRILSFLICGSPGQQSPQSCKFSLFVDYYKV